MTSLVRILVIAALVSCVTACVPTHTVKPLPNFVKTGLQPGDTITVKTHGGDTHEFEIKAIRGNMLIGENRQFDLQDIVSIKKHAWSRPESPCGGDKPLGCSLPFLVSLASERHSHYESKFYDACAQHDYCYRHGFASYGVDREFCDEEFLLDMQNLCPEAAVGKLSKVLEVLDDSDDSRQTCLTVANDYHRVVRRYGEKRYQTTGSTYCEYDGPKPTGIGAPPEAPPTTESQ